MSGVAEAAIEAEADLAAAEIDAASAAASAEAAAEAARAATMAADLAIMQANAAAVEEVAEVVETVETHEDRLSWLAKDLGELRTMVGALAETTASMQASLLSISDLMLTRTQSEPQVREEPIAVEVPAENPPPRKEEGPSDGARTEVAPEVKKRLRPRL